MAIIIDSLAELKLIYPDLIVKKVYEDTILNRFGIEAIEGTTPGTYTIRIFEPVAHLSRCCDPYEGDSNVTARDVSVICLKDGQTYCEADLASIIRNADFRFTTGLESAGSVEEVITEGQLAAFLEAIDKLVFQGDTDSTDSNLNLYDGLIKQARENGVVIEATEGSIYDAFVQGYLRLMQIEGAKSMGQVAIFIPEEYGDLYRLALTRFRLLVDNPKNDLNVPGLQNVTIIPTRGLTGINTMLITPLRNVKFLTNRRADLNTYEWRYIVDREGDYYIWRVKTIFGVILTLPDFAVVVDVDPSVLTNPMSIDVSIINPTNDDGSVRVSNEAAAAGTAARLSASEVSELTGQLANLIQVMSNKSTHAVEEAEAEVVPAKAAKKTNTKSTPAVEDNNENEKSE